MTPEKTVVFTLSAGGQNISLSAPEGTNLLEALRQRPDLAPPAPCAGRGRCGRCRVVLDDIGEGGSPPVDSDETRVLTEADLTSGIRLACRVPVSQGMAVRLEDAGVSKIETRAEGLPFDLNPVLVRRNVVLTRGSLEDQRPASERLEDALNLPEGTLGHSLISLIPSIPDGKTVISVILEDGRPVALDVAAKAPDELWAAAVDIGTTTVAMYLVNLKDGRVAGSRAELNRQGPFGADVISRLEHARKGRTESGELQRAITGQLESLLRALTSEHGVNPVDVHMLAVAGNTVMIHLMAGWDATGIGEAPFLPAALVVPPFPASEIGIGGFPRLRVRPLPSLSAYVGADITGGIVASGMYDRKGIELLLDIGTNGEMALGDSDGLVCCSTAAGPAFEGAHLSSGIGSIPGAVDHVDWIDGRMFFTTIDKKPAVGFCGSGVVDLVAFLVRSGLMDDTGRLAEEIPDGHGADFYGGLTIEKGEYGSVLVWQSAGGTGRPLTFTQKDLREVQLAKAAVAAGVETLMGQAGIRAADVRTLWLAGGFGSYIRPDSAAAIGLIPPGLAEKTRSLGNAAARGALLCLLSKEKADEALLVSRQAKTIELSGRPDFQNAYIEAMMFTGP